MTDSRQTETRLGRTGFAVLGLVTTAAIVVVLWRPIGEAGRLVLVLAATAAAGTAYLYLRRVAPFAVQPAAVATVVGADARALPFALIVDRAADPMLVVAGGERTDLNARRFVFANAAARELLRIQ